MTATMKAVVDSLFGINKVANEFGVPRLILKDRLSGKVVHDTRLPGQCQLLASLA